MTKGETKKLEIEKKEHDEKLPLSINFPSSITKIWSISLIVVNQFF
jgi:hypothetical protein